MKHRTHFDVFKLQKHRSNSKMGNHDQCGQNKKYICKWLKHVEAPD